MSKDKLNQLWLVLVLAFTFNFVFCLMDGNSTGAVAFKVTMNGVMDLMVGFFIGWLAYSNDNNGVNNTNEESNEVRS